VTTMKRNTWQRDAVRQALNATAGFVSAQQLHAQLHGEGSTIGLATVYRALATLADENLADCLQSPDGEQLYRSCAHAGHHHHLICRHCGTTVELEAETVEQWTHSVARAHGFSQVSHVVDMFGTCASCAAQRG